MDFQSFKDDINAITVCPALMGEIMELTARLPAAEQTFENRAMRVIALLGEKGHGQGPDSAMLAMAVIVRLMALDAVLGDATVKRWTLPGDRPSRSYVHTCLLQAAAEETVLEGPQGQPVFELERFQARALQLTSASGSS